MFYKALILEIIACVGLIGLRVYQAMPETSLTMGETVVSIKSAPITDRQEDISTVATASPAPVAVPKLPAPKPARVSSLKIGALTFPVAGYGPEHVISVFGDARGKRSHQGIDIKAPKGTPVVAVTDGFIERVKEGGSGGKQIYLRDGSGRLYFYAHLDSWTVNDFDEVKEGDTIGTVGDTGNAKGTTPHLHFEILLGKEKKPTDPLKFWVGV